MDSHQITIATYNSIAKIYQDKFMDVDIYNYTYDIFLSFLDQPFANIFEIACGPGNIARYLLTKKPNLKISGIDPAENMVTLARANNPTADFKVMDCRNIEQLTEKFDAIICGFCMPYITRDETKKLIEDCYQLLNSEGIFYCSTMEGGYATSGLETNSAGNSMYVYYHEEMYLRNVLLNCNFEILQFIRQPYAKSDSTMVNDMFFIARKKEIQN